MKLNKIGKLIKSTGLHIGYVEFVKRNGEKRCMWFQSRFPAKAFRGGERVYNPTERQITLVRDIHKLTKDCIRAIRWEAVTYLAVNGKTYRSQQQEG